MMHVSLCCVVSIHFCRPEQMCHIHVQLITKHIDLTLLCRQALSTRMQANHVPLHHVLYCMYNMSYIISDWHCIQLYVYIIYTFI